MKNRIIMVALFLVGLAIGTVLAQPAAQGDGMDTLGYLQYGSGSFAYHLKDDWYGQGLRVTKVSLDHSAYSLVEIHIRSPYDIMGLCH